ncbi:MAG: UDP-N-acetylmuramate--L-alanine ligase, partial [Candidatus Pacebacteria bacterium]|nr:UDP-N-acetylmuramate--L-alanine ligase [Candidatus Paceibacterota bacterium]
DSIKVLAEFQSTMRRFEKVGVKQGVVYYDDYAHHPHQLKSTIKAFEQWLPEANRLIIAFQPHTYSRTKKLFDQFVEALGQAQEIVLLDIFASAREKFDPTVSSDLLVEAAKTKFPRLKIANLKTIKSLADYCQNQLGPGDALITLGAGDIYQVHQLI